MKPFLIATFMILGLSLGPTNKAQAQIVYGYTAPLENFGADSTNMMNGSGGFSLGNSSMMNSRGNSPWNSGSSRWSTMGSGQSFTGAANRTWSNRWSGSNQWNGFGRGAGMFQPSMTMSPTGMSSGFGGMMNMGMMNMGMRRR